MAKDTTANFKHIIGANDHRFGLWIFGIRSDIFRVTIKRRDKVSTSQQCNKLFCCFGIWVHSLNFTSVKLNICNDVSNFLIQVNYLSSMLQKTLFWVEKELLKCKEVIGVYRRSAFLCLFFKLKAQCAFPRTR